MTSERMIIDLTAAGDTEQDDIVGRDSSIIDLTLSDDEETCSQSRCGKFTTPLKFEPHSSLSDLTSFSSEDTRRQANPWNRDIVDLTTTSDSGEGLAGVGGSTRALQHSRWTVLQDDEHESEHRRSVNQTSPSPEPDDDFLARYDGLVGAYLLANNPEKSRKYGDVDGLPVGSRFKTRRDCWFQGIHGHPTHGIHGNTDGGAYSIVLSGGYEDDHDKGHTIIYTGSGGQRNNQFGAEGPQTFDQDLNSRNNRILSKSYETENPVRVIRGSRLGRRSVYTPREGYRYDGLYTVTQANETIGIRGHKICQFTLRRNAGQAPLRTC